MTKDGCLDIHLRVRKDTDPELFAWLCTLDDERSLPHGAKAIAIKQMLLAGLQAHDPATPARGGEPVLGDALPGLLRRVVEAALLEALPQALREAGWQATSESPAGPAPDDDAELLAALESSLLLPED